MTVIEIEKQCKAKMEKALEYLQNELKGVRTGRASPGLIEHIKVAVASYQSTMDLRELAAISAPEPALLVVKPFDPGVVKDIEKAILASNIGLTPMTEGHAIRLPIPPLSGERRKQLINEIKKMAESQKTVVRNARRDANREVETEEKAHRISEDDSKHAQDAVQKLIKNYETRIDEILSAKQKELETV